MKKRIAKKIIAIIVGVLAVLCAVFTFMACGEPEGECGELMKSAVFYCDANQWIDKNFLEENRVSGAYYEEENYAGGSDYIYDSTSPATRTIMIDNEATFNRIFTEYPFTVDFESRRVVLHIFGNMYARDFYLKNAEVKEGTLRVQYEMEKVADDINDACMPGQHCFMLILDRVSFCNAVFEEI